MSLKPRISVPCDVRKKIFLIFEGRVAEEKYFKALRVGHVYSGDIQTVIMCRGPSKRSVSNPLRIAEYYDNYFSYVQGNDCDTELFIDMVLAQLERDGQIVELSDKEGSDCLKELKRKLMEKRAATEKIIVSEEGAAEIITEYFYDKLGCDVTIELKKLRDRCLRLEGDEYHLIVDRDKESFYDFQVKEVTEICEKDEINLVITNPCFELWLLLHFDVSKESIIDRLSETGGLKKELLKYSKINEKGTTIPQVKNEYIRRIDNALDNLDSYCQDIESLKKETEPDVIGSNIGELMRELTGRDK